MRVVIIRNRLDDGRRALLGVAGFEDARADEHALRAELHHQRRVCGRRDAAGGEVDDGQLFVLVHIQHQLVGDLELLGRLEQLVGGHRADAADFGLHQPHMAHGLHDVARPRLALGADHRRALGDAAERFSEISRATDKRCLELCLINMIYIISRRQNFGFINIINLDRLQQLRLYEMSDTAFCHDRNADCFLDPFDHFRVTHAGNTTGGADICRDTLQSHYSAGTGCFCDLCLLRCGNVHDHAALEHLGKIFVQFVTVFRHFIYLPCISDKKSIY